MLGLRKSFGSAGKKLRKRSSASSSLNSDNNSIDEDSGASSSRGAMETIRSGLKGSMSSMSVPTKQAKPAEVTTPVASVDSSSDSEKTVSVKDELTSSMTTISRKQTSTSTFRIDTVTDVYRAIRRNILQLDEYTYTEQYFSRLDIESYRRYVANERLIRMPRRGSNWDRALRAALMFGENFVDFGNAIQGFCSDTDEASVTGLASCKLLLEIDNNSKALVPTFQALRELAVLVNQVIQIDGLSQSSKEVKHATADLYIDLIRLVGDIAVFYKQKLDNLSHGSVTIKFDVEFGKQIKHIWEHKARIVRHMWEVKLGKDSDGVESVRQKLNGRHSAHTSFYSQVNNTRRAEDTCEWLKSYLIDFLASEEKTFTITGPAGCGKTMLARWVRERLQRPLNDEEYFTLYYTFPFDSAEEATSLAFLKNILFQLLERSVGDVHLYEKLAATFAEYSKTRDQKKLEASLWATLDVSLRTLDDHGRQVVVIVDGLEEVTGTTPLAFHKTLREHIAKSEGARAITFSKHISHISQGCKHLLITQKYIVDDIRSFLRQFLGGVPAFTALTGVAEDRVLQELTDKAKDSFLWANLSANLLAKEANSESLVKTVQSLSSDVHDVIDKIVAKLPQILKPGPTRSIFSTLLVAHRPLTVGEVTELIRIDLGKKQRGSAIDIFQELPQLCGSLAVIRDARIHFKSKAVREHMLGKLGKTLPSSNEAHSQLTQSLLLYAKLNLDMAYEPSFEELSYAVVDEQFASYPLLQYAVQNWLFHFRSSGMCNADGGITLTAELKEVFPDSAFFALLERSCWSSDSTDLVKRYELALKVREGCFHDKGISVLQTFIILGNLHQSHSDMTDAAKCFYRAANVSQLVLSRSHSVTMLCTSKVIHVTEMMTFTCRTEVVTWRIRMIEFMIEETKASKGAHSHAVVRWYELLATLYVSIHDHHNATLIYKLIYEIYVFIEGKHSPRAGAIAEKFGGLDITLNADGDHRHIKEIEAVLLETDRGDGVEPTSVDIRLRLALVYIAQKKWVLAEEIFITLWRSISIACRLKVTWELHVLKLRVAIEYVKFLRELGRVQEAMSILTVLWVEYEHHVFENIEIIIRLKEIGMLFKAFGLLEVAVAIFSKLWGWFKSKGKTTHEDAVETTVLITEVVEEITTTTKKTTTTTTTTTEVTETVVKEIYETHYHRCRTSGKADEAFFRSCFVLIKLYQSLENWVQAEYIIKQTLEITWKAILTADVNIMICETHVTECIRLATSLAICHHRLRRFEEAERIYLRIFRVCFGSLDLEHECVKETLAILIAFYEEHHRHEKVIEIYIEVLERYRKHFGVAHARTIEIMYLLAAQCRMLGRKDEFTYYIEIFRVLNKGTKHCHHDARRAGVLLIEYYYEHSLWSELQQVCSLLWETFVHHHHGCGFEEVDIELVYKRYVYVLEFHAKVEFQVLYRLAKEYHTHAIVVFSQAAAIVLKAMIAFGGICERHHEHYHESVTIYEEYIKKTTTTKVTTTTVTETEITTVKTRLSKIYVTIITTGGKTTTTTFEKAIQLCLELYAHFKFQFGCWHETTLGKLREIIIIYRKIGSHECRTKMIEILQTAFISITSASINAMDLYAAAATLAAIYVTAGLVEYAEKLIQEVQHLIIFGNAFATKEITLKLDIKLSKLAFVFLTGFKQHLVEKTVSVWTYSEIMTSLLLEMALYEQYTHAVDSGSEIEVILLHGAKLRCFWEEAKLVRHEHLIVALDQKLFALFKNKFKAFLPAEDDITREFFVSFLTELGRTRSKVDFAALSCKAGNARVAQLLEKGEFRPAHDVARCAYRFAEKQGFYRDLHRVQYGYKLAEFMAGIDVRKPSDAKLAEEMLKTSREITATVLEVFKTDGIDFVHLNFKDLAGIVRLLGSQGDYKELERILRDLWNSREVKEWDSARVLSIGRLLVHVYYANGKLGPAVEMCDRLCYNLQRSKGYLHPDALDASRLLASLYATGLGPAEAATRRPDKAMGVYEDVLRQIDFACGGGVSTSSPRPKRQSGLFRRSAGPGSAASSRVETDPKVLAAAASLQFELLKRAHLRLGAWTKPVKEFADLHERLVERLGKGNLSVASPEAWKGGEKEKGDGLGMYLAPREWRLESVEMANGGGRGWVCGVGPNGTMSAGVKV